MPASLSAQMMRLEQSAGVLLVRLRIFFSRRLTRSEDRDLVQDCAQETLSRLAGKIRNGEVILNLEAYALSIANNVFLEFLGRVGAERRLERVDNEKTQWQDSGSLSNPTGDPALELQDRCLTRCLDALPPADRELIDSWYANPEGKAKVDHHKQMQKSFGNSSTLRVRIFRIVQRLRDCCSQCMENETNRSNSH